MGRRYVRDGAVGLGAAFVAWFVADVARAGMTVCMVSFGAACLLAVATVEVPGVVKRRVDAFQEAMFAEVAARLRKDGRRHGAAPEGAAPADTAGAQVREAGELRALADEGRVLLVRLGDWPTSDARLADDMARAVAFWERRARWALRGHRVEWVAFGGAAGRDRFAVPVGQAKDRVAAQVQLLLSVAADPDRGSSI